MQGKYISLDIFNRSSIFRSSAFSFFSNFCIDTSEGTVQLFAKIVAGNTNDDFIPILQIVASVLGMKKPVRVGLGQVVKSLSVMADDGVAWGCGLVTGETFNHGGQEAQDQDEGGGNGFHGVSCKAKDGEKGSFLYSIELFN